MASPSYIHATAASRSKASPPRPRPRSSASNNVPSISGGCRSSVNASPSNGVKRVKKPRPKANRPAYGPAPRYSGLESLPVELFDMIMAYLPPPVLLRLRRLSKTLDALTARHVGKACFKDRAFTFTLYDLRKLKSLSDHPVFSQYIRRLYVFDCSFLKGIIRTRAGELPKVRSWYPRYKAHHDLYRSYLLSQKERFEKANEAYLLETANRAFEELANNTMAYNDYPEDARTRPLHFFLRERHRAIAFRPAALGVGHNRR